MIEYARNVLGLKKANSAEVSPDTPDPVIDLLPDQKGVEDKGGTMRRGAYPCRIQKDSRAYEAYQQLEIRERHRHRFEFNNDYRDNLEKAGMLLSGVSPDGRLVEIIELPKHPWFVGTQFHPEFRSRLRNPHPLFRDYIKAALQKRAR